MMSKLEKSYSEMIKLQTFEDRFRYLKQIGHVGEDTFGYDRYLNQMLYHSPEWRRLRNIIIVRDHKQDMAMPGFTIYGRVLIHHINSLTKQQVLERDPIVFDPENLVTISFETHNALHYGGEVSLDKGWEERKPNDTCPWKE